MQTNENGGFTHNHLYELNATADVGYYFDHWEGDVDQLEKGPFSSENKVLEPYFRN